MLKGFGCENYEILTSDGFILSLQRIVNKNLTNYPPIPVFLQHGFLDASSTWVINERHNSLGFILADTGKFDVWLGNK